MRGAVIQNIGQKKDPFNRSLTVNYWINKGFSLIEYPFKRLYEKAVESLIYEVDNMTRALYDFYEDAENLSEEEAKEILPQIMDLRQSIGKQKERFSSINYADSSEARKKFYLLVRTANKLEARIHSQAYKNADPVPTPSYVTKKLRSNSKKAVVNGLS